MIENITPHNSVVTNFSRQVLNKHQPAMLWFTGLSASGKSTLAYTLEYELHKRGYHTYVLDGDNIRSDLNSDLSFSYEDRVENIRRVGAVGKLMVDAGLITLAAFISPSIKEREYLRGMFPPDRFIEIYCSASLPVCESRDPKGLYKKAREGEVKEFTGVSSPYEPPLNPEIEIDTSMHSIENSVCIIIGLLISYGVISKEPLCGICDF